MYWFIGAFIVASAIFFFAPQKASAQVQEVEKNSFLSLSLLVLPVIVLCWLIIETISQGVNYATIAAIGFVITACLIALPQWHKFIMPAALLTATGLVVMVLQHL